MLPHHAQIPSSRQRIEPEPGSPLDVAIDATRVAGRILRSGYGKVQRVSYKGETNLLTEYDRRSEEAIVRRIQAAFPEHAILAEEGSGAGRGDRARDRWIVDPLDGTTNYAHGYPVFCVSIAYERDGRLEVGVVFDVLRRDRFVAERGKGAYLNGRRLQVSGTTELIKAILATGFPYDRARLGIALAQFTHMAPRTQGLRRAGAAALSLAYVAAGRLDGFWEATIQPWDVAAGALMIQEAGGAIARSDGTPYDADATHVAASNGVLQSALLSELAEVARTNGGY